MTIRERLYRTDAVVLRRVSSGEADRILTVFTPHFGKLKLIAKGVRKTTSRKAGHIELFSLVDLLVSRARGLDVLTQAETVRIFDKLREDLDKTSCAYYLAELVDSFTEESDKNSALFELFVFTLARLNQASDPHLLMRYFELQLFSLTGFQPQLHFCVLSDEPLQAVDDNYFSFVDGGMISPSYKKDRRQAKLVPLSTLKVLRFLQTQPWEKIQTLHLTATTRQQVETLLLGYITHILERRVKSVDFLRKLQRTT